MVKNLYFGNGSALLAENQADILNALFWCLPQVELYR
jgi:hypothetical protein